MAKNNKKKKKNMPAPDMGKEEKIMNDSETEETEQMAQEAEHTEKTEQGSEEVLEETAEKTPEENVQIEEELKEEPDTPETETEAGEETADPEEDAKGFFSKNKKDKKDEAIAELTDKLQRQMAEFENYRKRTEREKASMYDMGTRDTVEKLLPVIDNFERGLAGADESDPFAEGMQMIYRQMMTILDGIGVTPIDAAGKEFDPNLHNAVMHVDDDSFGENIVVEELQKGYMYKDHVVRHSMVKVAN